MRKKLFLLIVFFVSTISLIFITEERIKADSITVPDAYFYSGSTCKKYKNSIITTYGAYCMQAGANVNLSATYTPCKYATTCVEEAAAYYGIKENINSYFYGAQTLLNGRKYYTDSSCSNEYDKTEVLNKAYSYCYTYPSFVKSTTSNNIALTVGQTATLTDNNNVLSSYNVRVSSPNIMVIKEGNTLKIKALNTLVNDIEREYVKVSLILEKGNTNPYKGYCSSNSQNYMIPESLPYVARELNIYIGQTVSEETAKLKIYKYDNTTPLSGVKFKVGTSIDQTGHVVGTEYTSDATGLVFSTDNAIVGETYYYEETSALATYVSDSVIRSIYIKEANKQYVINTYNVKENEYGLVLRKSDQFGNPIQGVQYKVVVDTTNSLTEEQVNTKLSGTENTDWLRASSNEFGLIPFVGSSSKTTFYFKEICEDSSYISYGTENDKYVCDTAIHSYTIGDETINWQKWGYDSLEACQNNSETNCGNTDTVGTGHIDYLNLVNIKNVSSSFILFKKDSDSNEPLENVKFEVYNADTNTLVTTLITNEYGYASIENIENGNYYFKEVETLKGYTLDEKTYSFKIDDENPYYFILLDNEFTNAKTGLTNTYFIAGLIIMLSACTYLVIKKKEKFI